MPPMELASSITWWNWKTRPLQSSFRDCVKNSDCEDARDCVCHDEFSLLRTKIREIAGQEGSLRAKMMGQETKREQRREKHVREMKLLEGMCRDCNKMGTGAWCCKMHDE